MAEKAKRLSLVDLENLQDEALVGFNAEADANALLPPIPAGKYLLSIKLQENPEGEWESKKGKSGAPYLSTTIMGTVVENPLNPKEFFGRRVVFNNIMTMVMENTGTTGVQAVLQGLGKGGELANGPQTGSRQAALLTKALAGEPFVGAEVDWEASFYDTDKKEDLYPRIRGMKRFPRDEKTGVHTPKIESPDKLMEADARVFLRRWIAVKDLETEIAKKKGSVVDEVAVDTAISIVADSAAATASIKSGGAPRPGQKRTA